MTELTSNARFIQGINMLTAKIQDPIALEALVKAMEACFGGKGYGSSGVEGSWFVGAEIKHKHPLEDYEVTERDVGSLVYCVDYCEDQFWIHQKLSGYHPESDYPFETDLESFRCAKPYLDPISLHFKPFYATEDSVAPDDLGQHYAVLWSNGDIELVLNVYNESWTREKLDEFWIIGYRPLKFVNPLEEV